MMMQWPNFLASSANYLGMPPLGLIISVKIQAYIFKAASEESAY